MHNPVINNRTSAYSGILMQKSSQSNYIYTSFSTDLVDKFFVGRNHPIEYSPAFEKVLNLNYDQENINVEIDVASGCGEFLEKPGILSFDLLLNYLVDQRRRTNKNMDELVHGAKIVCRRGVLNKLVNAPYRDNSEFKFAVKRFQGIFFIKELSTDTIENQNLRGITHSYLTNFKKKIIYPFGDDTYQAPPPDVVSTWEQMQGIYLGNLTRMSGDVLGDSETFKIFYGTEIDAFDKDKNVVEVKLQNGEINTTASAIHNQSIYIAEKLRKWYFQTQFVGGDTVVVGFRQESVVTSIKKIKIDSLSSMVKSQNRWNNFVSFSSVWNTLSSICEFYDKNVQRKKTLIVESRPHERHVSYHIHDDEVDNILPDDFKKAFEEKVTLVDNNNGNGNTRCAELSSERTHCSRLFPC